MGRRVRTLVAVLVAGLSLGAGAAYGQYQTRNQHFGVSGGNVNDISKLYCCSGTLGALVASGGKQYILSNNHVLARSGQALPGEDISQPGLIDNNCRPGTIVGNFTAAPKLGSNVDAAIAELRSGTMDSTGSIQVIGTISSVTAAPNIGMAVMKSGRTTGTTTGQIGAINANIKVQYQAGCGTGKKFSVSYRNQMVINSSTFSAGGDSGSLIVTAGTCHQPVGLLFAGSSTTTIANPISDVVKSFQGLGYPIAFVGGNCSAKAAAAPAPSEAMLDQADRVAKEHGQRWLAHGAVIGVGIGNSDENPYEAVVVVYIDRQAGTIPELPAQAGGVRVKHVFTEPFIATACCQGCK